MNVVSNESLLNRPMLSTSYTGIPFGISFTSLLVNAILVDACHGLAQPEHRNEPWNPSSLDYRPLWEARHHCELETGNNKITAVQIFLIQQISSLI